MFCKDCGSQLILNLENWIGDATMPAQCPKCDMLYLVDQVSEIIKPFAFNKEIIPKLLEYTKIFVFNKQHIKHLEPGIIIARDHLYYRIKFMDNELIWMPQHWVIEVPKEML